MAKKIEGECPYCGNTEFTRSDGPNGVDNLTCAENHTFPVTHLKNAAPVVPSAQETELVETVKED